ncbi:MAG: head-tail connector protein [Candidatus Dormibacteria bacterium]
MPYAISNGLCSLGDVKAALRLTPNDTTDDNRIGLAIDAATRMIERTTMRRFWQDSAVSSRDYVAESPWLCPVDDFESAFVVHDGVTTAGSPNVSSLMAPWDQTHIGDVVSGLPIPAGATIVTVTDANHVVLSANCTTTATNVALSSGVTVQTDPAGDGSFGLTWGPGDYQLEPLNKLLNGHPWPYTKVRATKSLAFPIYGGIAYPMPYTQALIRVTTRWGWLAVPSDVQKAAIVQAIALFKADDTPFGATAFGEVGVLRQKVSMHPTAELLIEPYRASVVLVA